MDGSPIGAMRLVPALDSRRAILSLDTRAIATLLDHGDYVVLGRSAPCHIAFPAIALIVVIHFALGSLAEGE
jgi:hypothetical protein